MAIRYVDANILEDLAAQAGRARGDLDLLRWCGGAMNYVPSRGWNRGDWDAVRGSLNSEIALLDADARSLRDRARRTREAAAERALMDFWSWISPALKTGGRPLEQLLMSIQRLGVQAAQTLEDGLESVARGAFSALVMLGKQLVAENGDKLIFTEKFFSIIPLFGFSSKERGEIQFTTRKNPDGTITVTMIEKGDLEARAYLVDGEAGVRIGKLRPKLSAEVGGAGGLRTVREREFTFGTSDQDYADLAALIALTGASPKDAEWVVALFGARHQTSDSRAVGGTLEGKAEVSGITKLAGASFEGSAVVGSKTTVLTGQTQQIERFVDLDMEHTLSLMGVEERVEIQGRLSWIERGDAATRMVLTVEMTSEQGLSLDDVKRLIPNAEVGISQTKYEAVKLQVTIMDPGMALGEVQARLNAGDVNGAIGELQRHSHIVVTGIEGDEAGIGAKAKVGAANETIGAGGEMSIRREREVMLN